MSRPDRDVMVCRDCCCGSTSKHPATDHDAQRTALETAAGDGVRVRVVECLDECDRSNVVLVRDFTLGRRPVDTWLGDVHGDDATRAVVQWVAVGGPVPDALTRHVFPRQRVR